jgi:hypothetical protein
MTSTEIVRDIDYKSNPFGRPVRQRENSIQILERQSIEHLEMQLQED